MKVTPLLILSIGALLLLGTGGCDETECAPCVSAECGNWAGVYYGQMTGDSGSCTDVSSLTGDVRVTVFEIGGSGADGGSGGGDVDSAETLTLELADNEGHWTRFDGDLCETEDSKEPYTYSFTVTYSEMDADFNTNNTIFGYFSLNDEGSPSIKARYTILRASLNDPEDSCDMFARMEANQ